MDPAQWMKTYPHQTKTHSHKILDHWEQSQSLKSFWKRKKKCFHTKNQEFKNRLFQAYLKARRKLSNAFKIDFQMRMLYLDKLPIKWDSKIKILSSIFKLKSSQIKWLTIYPHLGSHLRMYTTRREKTKKEMRSREQWI